MQIFGFTLIRNGLKYDYPFRESISSMAGICEEIVVALGDSNDGTEEVVRQMPKVIVVPTVWDENLRTSGIILSQQTNVALRALRKAHSTGWGLYLQGDEVISQDDYAVIRTDMQRAEQSGCDAISFRYWHFWHAYNKICFKKRWYPQEIRAVQLSNLSIESFGDAQSFRGFQKVFNSEATIYHYGHVREESAYKNKLKDFNRWWHSDAEMPKVLAKSMHRDPREKTLSYYGPHPQAMNSRMKGKTSEQPRKIVLVYGNKHELRSDFWMRVNADLNFTNSGLEYFFKSGPKVAMRKIWWDFHSVPDSMESPQARPFSLETFMILQFSAVGITVRARS